MIDEIRFRYNISCGEHVMTKMCRDALRSADRVAALDCLRDIMAEAKALYEEILGSDAGEKVADSGGAFEGLMDGLAKACATDPAPGVCEWTMGTHPDDGSHYDTACGDAWCSVLGGTPKQDNYSFCPSCGKPIKFTEAK